MSYCKNRLVAVLLGCVLGLPAASMLWGQGPQAPVRPEPAPLRVEALDPKLEAILQDWERESAQIKVLQGKHFRQEFNKVFSVEKRSMGVFYYEAPDKGRFDMQGVAIKEGDVSRKIDPQTQKPYQLASGTDQGWVCTGTDVLMIDPVAKQFEISPIPPQLQGQNIIQSPLPFLFGMKAADAKRRFKLTLYSDTKAAWVIDAEPRNQMDAQNYKVARIALSKENFVPMEVSLIDPPGTLMTVYTFRDVKVNPGKGVVAALLPLFKDANPFQPNLRGYKKVLPPVVQQPEVQPVNGVREADSSGRSSLQRPPAPR